MILSTLSLNNEKHKVTLGHTSSIHNTKQCKLKGNKNQHQIVFKLKTCFLSTDIKLPDGTD